MKKILLILVNLFLITSNTYAFTWSTQIHLEVIIIIAMVLWVGVRQIHLEVIIIIAMVLWVGVRQIHLEVIIITATYLINNDY